MAKYIINTFSQDKFSFRIYHNTKKKTWQKIKQETGCYGLINTAYFQLTTYQVHSQTMIAGKWIKDGPWNEYGISIDKNGYLTVDTTRNAVYDYTIGLPVCYIKGKKYATYKDNAKNGASFIGTTSDNRVVCLISSKDDGVTTAEACEIMINAGCINILRFDGSWSSQGSLGPGLDVDPSQERKAAVYLLIYKKGTETAVDSNLSAIGKIQDALNKKYNSGIIVDGYWGPTSKKALVKAIQKEIGVTADGSFGPKTQSACPVLKKGAKGNIVWLLQAALCAKGQTVATDSSFGSATLSAVKAYQKKNGLGVDGSVGPATWKSLMG